LRVERIREALYVCGEKWIPSFLISVFVVEVEGKKNIRRGVELC